MPVAYRRAEVPRSAAANQAGHRVESPAEVLSAGPEGFGIISSQVVENDANSCRVMSRRTALGLAGVAAVGAQSLPWPDAALALDDAMDVYKDAKNLFQLEFPTVGAVQADPDLKAPPVSKFDCESLIVKRT